MADMLAPLREALTGRYSVDRELGHGGNATVFLARDLKHDRWVALKVMHPELAASVGVERFNREIQIVAGFTHPHILPLYDSGAADGFLYFVMPYVDGESLRQRLSRDTRLPEVDAVAIARQIADALQYAHERDVVHRDVKPENILFSGGHALLADFGIARVLPSAGDRGLTRTGTVMGSLHYISPEQVASANPDRRSDVYSLGCVVYEMLAGRPPFVGPTIESILYQHASAEPEPLELLRPGVTPHVADAVRRSLAKSPDQRFDSARAMGEALASANRETRARRVPRSLAWAAALLVLLGGAGFIAKAMQHREPSELQESSLSTAPPTTGALPAGTHAFPGTPGHGALAAGMQSSTGSTLPSRATTPSAARRTPDSGGAASGRAPLDAAAVLYRDDSGVRRPLAPGAAIEVGDKLSLDVRGDEPMYVYVLDEDEQGNLVILFPLQEVDAKNPLAPGVVHRLPGARGSKSMSWGVSSAGGQETILVIGTRTPQPGLESDLAGQPHAQVPGEQLDYAQVSRSTLRGLRSIGHLVESPVPQGAASRLSEILLGLQSRTDRPPDLWTWQIHLKNSRS